jgi:hypothetical protein
MLFTYVRNFSFGILPHSGICLPKLAVRVPPLQCSPERLIKFSFCFLPGLGSIHDGDEGNSFLFGDEVCDNENIPLLIFPLFSFFNLKLLKYFYNGCIHS